MTARSEKEEPCSAGRRTAEARAGDGGTRGAPAPDSGQDGCGAAGKLRILILSDESWNDSLRGNNVTTNWFEGMDAEFANVYRSPEPPENRVCKRYFHLSDSMLLQAVLKRGTCGHAEHYDDFPKAQAGNIDMSNRVDRFAYMVKGDLLRLARQFMWKSWRWRTDELRAFILNFKPDVIFSQRYATSSFIEIERYVWETARAPIVAFGADEDYSLLQIKLSPFWWIARLMTRAALQNMAPHYACYYTVSEGQSSFYAREFGCPADVIYKGAPAQEPSGKEPNEPLRMIYAGRLYCSRWTTLAMIGRILHRINAHGIRCTLDIYTKDRIAGARKRLLRYPGSINMLQPLPQKTLRERYRNYDVAIHAESFDLRNRLWVRESFSTKIVDCLASGCAVLAICGRENAGYRYLKKQDAALCACNGRELESAIHRICGDHSLIRQYRRRAYECCTRHHERARVSNGLLRALTEAASTVEGRSDENTHDKRGLWHQEHGKNGKGTGREIY